MIAPGLRLLDCGSVQRESEWSIQQLHCRGNVVFKCRFQSTIRYSRQFVFGHFQLAIGT